MSSRKINRRTLLQAGLTTAAGAAGAATIGIFSQSAPPENAGCETPAQIEGPFYPNKDQVDKDLDLTLVQGRSQRAEGEVVHIQGQVLDDQCRPVAGALVEIWQANKHGRYSHERDPNPAPLDPNFQGWGQFRTDEEGRYRFKTIIPGAYPAAGDWWRPPHIHFKVSKRGYHELVTQMYFAEEKLNDTDGILQDLSADDQAKVIVAFETGAENYAADDRVGKFDITIRQVRRG